jgi:hypothetical protein
MPLVVETGIGSSTAEAYCSVVEASAYHSARGNTAWGDLDPDVQEQCLRKATSYMVGEYRLRWSGVRLNETQLLDWPRSLVPRKDVTAGAYYPNDAVPLEVRQACASLALRAATASLLKDQSQRKASVTVGPISTTYEAGSKVATTYAEIDALLRPFLGTRKGQIPMVRA